MKETYTVREVTVPANGHYEVAKWSGGDQPSTYDVLIKEDRTVYCNCLGYRKRPGREHKHVKLVLKWLEDGKPIGREYHLTNVEAKQHGYNWLVEPAN